MARGSESLTNQIGTVGRWRTISGLVRALAEVTETDERRFAHLAIGLTAPVRRLDELATLAERTLGGDAHARCELRSAIDTTPTAPDIGARIDAIEDERCACGCGGGDPTAEPPPGADSPAVLDASALGALLLVVDAEYREDGDGARAHAVDTVMGLVVGAGLLSGLSAALTHGGHDGLVAQLAGLGDLGLLSWAGAGAAPMSTLSGEMPGLPGLPGLPGHPGLPGLPGIPELPPGLGSIIDRLIALLRKPPIWDPELFDHFYPWWDPPLMYIDPGVIARILCLLDLRQLLNKRSLLQPPLATGPVTWNDGITSITQSGACSGDHVTIHGTGFGATQPAGVVVLVPHAHGCRPVVPDGWSDTAIKITLPATVSSGPIGFGDTGYIAQYDAWAAAMNFLADVIHRLPCGGAINAPPIPPFYQCPPDSSLTHLQAGPPIISAFTANWATTAAVEPADPITLRWTIANAVHVKVERTSAAGPQFGGSPALLDPAGTSYTLPAPANGARAVYHYRLTATGPCGTATRDVTVVAVKRPRLHVASAEVTQSIQTVAPSVRLVEHKPTVVRVTVRHGLNGWGTNNVPGVKGRIRVHRGGQISPWYDAANGSAPMAPSPGASITVAANPQRNNTNDTLNFLIPPAWCTATAWFQIEVRVAGFGAGNGFAGFDELVSGTTGSFLFEHRRTLELRYIRVNWGGSTPSVATCLSTLRGAVPLLPTPTANIFPLAGVGIQNPGGTGDDDRDDLLDDFDDRHNCSVWEALTEWLGSDCPDDDGTDWVLIPGAFHRGRAKDIPSNVCFTPPSNGPYAAHELSHCFNQVHVGLLCANGQQAQGGDPASAWPNNAKLVDVPFDVTRNVALSLAGTGVFDVMTYCGSPNNTWPMPARWQRLWDWIGS
jgi:hypothetical protein